MKKQRFSLRKYKVGVVSVIIGAFFSMTSGTSALAEELLETNVNQQIISQETNKDGVELDKSEVENQNLIDEKSDSSTDKTEQIPSSESISYTNSLGVGETSETLSLPTRTVETNSETSESVQQVQNEKTTTEQENTSSVVVEQNSQNATTLATKLDNDSNSLISIPQVWATGYKGEGSVIAIIDSGLDVNHDVLRISNISKAKFQTSEQINAAKEAAGIQYGEWFSDKVVFGYNYADGNSVLKEVDSQSHGMHVTGIAAGNPTQTDGGRYIQGVAPEAQVMFMRVFSDISSTTGAALYVRAIEDAVKLGADSINLSLGGANGSLVNMDDTVVAAIELARRSGVSVVIAAGNDGAFGAGHSIPWSSNPDYGLVADPSTAKNAISVASYNNSVVNQHVLNILGLENDAFLNFGRSSFNNPDRSEKKFEIGKAYDYVYAGLGQEEDFVGLDLTGKLALIQRGNITFSTKIANATKAGAEGVIIFNNVPGEENLGMALDETAIAIPSVFIPAEFGEALAVNSYQIQFNNESEAVENPEADQLSAFSSWGLTADGELKPDIAAPGGSIYSSVNDGAYASQSGTSMAAPHVAGAAVLVKQYLKSNYPEKTNEEIETLVKNLLMSTAKAHFNSINGAYTSPRQQGAGLMDVAAAISTDLYVTGVDQYPSITLGNVEDIFEFEIEVHNIGNEDKKLTYITHVNTDQTFEGLNVLVPRELTTIAGREIIVKANSSQRLTIQVDTTAFSEELLNEMPNGYFLEGFVRFTNPEDGSEVISIPYVGFRGEFQNLPVVETPISELLPNGEVGFYYTPQSENLLEIDAEQDFTGLITNHAEKIYSTDRLTEEKLKVLGAYKNDDGQFVLELDENGKLHLAISPNGDGNQDSLTFKGVFLRNYTDLVATVYAADDVEMSKILWKSQSESGNKNYYSGNEQNPKSTVVYPTEWSGLDKDGNALPDGKYKYVLTYLPEVPGADVQQMTFEVVIDRQSPEITTATYDETSFRFDPRPATEVGPAGIFRERVFYLATNDQGLTTILTTKENGHVTVEDNKVFVAQNEDGSFTLPLDLADISTFYYVVEDFAGNVSSEKVENLISIGNDKGLVSVTVVDMDTNKEASIDYSFIVRDEAGKVVTELPRYAENNNVIQLPFGTYSVEMFLYDTEWASLTGENKYTVTIDENNSTNAVQFFVQLKEKANLLVDIDKILPTGSIIQLQTADGRIIQLPNAKYSKTDYGKFVPVGNYTIVPVLPEGYEFLEDLVVDVVSEQSNLKKLTLINKVVLRNFLAQNLNLESLATYYNSETSLQVAYQHALNIAQSIADQKHSQVEIDDALENLISAFNALNGLDTDFTALNKEINEYPTIQSDFIYYNAASINQIAYDSALRVAQLTLNKPNVTQSEVDQALFNLVIAKTALDGQTTDFTALETEINAYDTVKASYNYYNADADKQESYDSIVNSAKQLLQQVGVSQAFVNNMLAKLQGIRVELNGRKTDFSALRNAVSVSSVLKVTDAKYINASETVKQAYDKALAEAKAILEDASANQAAVDQALTNLTKAQEKLDGVASPVKEEVQPSVPISETNEIEHLTPPPVNSDNLPSKDVIQIHRPDKQAESIALPNQTYTLEFSRNVQHSEKSLSTQEKNEVWVTTSQNTDQTRLPNTGTKNSYMYIILGIALGLSGFKARKKP